jgi:hypothetical protein
MANLNIADIITGRTLQLKNGEELGLKPVSFNVQVRSTLNGINLSRIK